MNGKLIKLKSSYALVAEETTLHYIDSIYGNIVADTQGNDVKKLSLKNCQAIELGYDLDELACNEIRIDISIVNDIDEKIKNSSSTACVPLREGGCVGSNLYNQVKGFEKGFQKCLELMSDKRFSEEDMLQLAGYISVMAKGCEMVPSINLKEESNKFIQSLQQTEWNVEFNPDELDSNGCLTLKKI
jgi:hypothetical protein